MSRASEDALALLHNRIAEAMLGQLTNSTRATLLLMKDREEGKDIPADVIEFLMEIKEVSPSFLTAATKFLKDNNITCDPSEDSNLSDLAKQLQAKRVNSKGNVLSIPIGE